MSKIKSPQKENCENPSDLYQRNTNRTFFSRQQNPTGAGYQNQNQFIQQKDVSAGQSNLNTIANNSNYSNQLLPNASKPKIHPEQHGQRLSLNQDTQKQQINKVVNNQQTNLASNSKSLGGPRRKIFSVEDDTQSTSSYQTVKQSKISSTQEGRGDVLVSKGITNQEQQYYGMVGQEGNMILNKEGLNGERMIQELQLELVQLQEAKKVGEETHRLEIDDTKKHYEFKLGESVKKQQELVMKMQTLQQSVVHSQGQVSALTEQLQAKDEELINLRHLVQEHNIYKQQIQQSHLNGKRFDSSQQYKELLEQKEGLEKIISEGKLYIEKIKNESTQKTNNIIQLQEEIHQKLGQYNHLLQQFEQSSNNTTTMRMEIDKLIASNLELSRQLETERKERDDKQAGRVNLNYQMKGSVEEKNKRIGELEMKLKEIFDQNTKLNSDLNQKLSMIGDLNRKLGEKQVASKVFGETHKQMKGFGNDANGLHQITEEWEEESMMEISRRGGYNWSEINVSDGEDLRSVARNLLVENEKLRTQAEVMRNQSKIQIQQPPNQVSADLFKELTQNISNLQKDKENLLYENSIIVSQMKNERKNREDEVKILRQQIQNIQKHNQIQVEVQQNEFSPIKNGHFSSVPQSLQSNGMPIVSNLIPISQNSTPQQNNIVPLSITNGGIYSQSNGEEPRSVIRIGGNTSQMIALHKQAVQKIGSFDVRNGGMVIGQTSEIVERQPVPQRQVAELRQPTTVPSGQPMGQTSNISYSIPRPHEQYSYVLQHTAQGQKVQQQQQIGNQKTFIYQNQIPFGQFGEQLTPQNGTHYPETGEQTHKTTRVSLSSQPSNISPVIQSQQETSSNSIQHFYHHTLNHQN